MAKTKFPPRVFVTWDKIGGDPVLLIHQTADAVADNADYAPKVRAARYQLVDEVEVVTEVKVR